MYRNCLVHVRCHVSFRFLQLSLHENAIQITNCRILVKMTGKRDDCCIAYGVTININTNR
jgi:hypothetical protein